VNTSSGRSTPTTVAELKEVAEVDAVDFLFAMFVDMNGKPCAKMVPVSAIDGLLSDGAGFAGFAAGPMGQTPSSPDILAMPDLSSYMPAPWRPGLGIIQCDPYVLGEPWPFAPRVILRRQIGRLAEAGYALKVGAEPEYFLVRRSAGGGIEVADPHDQAQAPCYDARALTRMYDHLTTVSRHINALGWVNYANDHEDANGQFEQNFRYADALTTADRLILFRYMVHAVASEAGMRATFMPKPFTGLTGNGLHTHLSLWSASDDEELFATGDDPRGLGLSPLAYHWIGGLLEHARSMSAVICPTVNSYKRIGVPAPRSGATWAPSLAAYGGNNRTHLLRVPEPGRVEHRGVDGSANPYLALSAMIGAGLDGIDREIDPGPPNASNLFALSPAELAARGIVSMPPTLLHAVEALEADTIIRDALGKTGDGDYIDYFAATKRQEFFDFHAQVTPWEVDRYLALI
jgi:glutamine synthetase